LLNKYTTAVVDVFFLHTFPAPDFQSFSEIDEPCEVPVQKIAILLVHQQKSDASTALIFFPGHSLQ
jgi:hypothetical protein